MFNEVEKLRNIHRSDCQSTGEECVVDDARMAASKNMEEFSPKSITFFFLVPMPSEKYSRRIKAEFGP